MKKIISNILAFFVVLSCMCTVNAAQVNYLGEMAVSVDDMLLIGTQTENRIVYVNKETEAQELDVSYLKDGLKDTGFGGTKDERVRLLYNYVTGSYTAEHYEQYLYQLTGVEFECEISFSPVASGASKNGVEYSMMEITILSRMDEQNRYKDVLVISIVTKGDDVYFIEGIPTSERKPAYMEVVDNLRIAEKSEMPIKIVVNGETVFPDSYPFIKDDRTLVPIRAIAEKLGYDVSWNAEERKVTLSDEKESLSVIIDSMEMSKEIKETQNTEIIPIDVAATIVNDRTYLPLRAVGEALGCKVSWDAENRTVIIDKK